jgi:hypothetical protein
MLFECLASSKYPPARAVEAAGRVGASIDQVRAQVGRVAAALQHVRAATGPAEAALERRYLSRRLVGGRSEEKLQEILSTQAVMSRDLTDDR